MAGDSDLESPEEMQKKDPLGTQIWKLYSRTKSQLPNQERMENLTWRMMAMHLKRREQAARCAPFSHKAPPAPPHILHRHLRLGNLLPQFLPHYLLACYYVIYHIAHCFSRHAQNAPPTSNPKPTANPSVIAQLRQSLDGANMSLASDAMNLDESLTPNPIDTFDL